MLFYVCRVHAFKFNNFENDTMKVSVNKVKIDRFVNYEMRYYSTGFESKICLRTQNVTGTFEKQAPVDGPD